MTTRLFIVFLCCVAGVMCGLALSNKTRHREKYFAQLLMFMDRLFSDIGFLQNTIEQIVIGFECKSTHLAKNLNEYAGFINGNELKLTQGVLTKRELELVKDFFIRLGTLDLSSQLDELSAKKAMFTQIFEAAKQRNKSYGKAYIKLGFLLGLGLGILFL